MALNYLSLLGKKLCYFASALIDISIYSLVIFITKSVFNEFQ